MTEEIRCQDTGVLEFPQKTGSQLLKGNSHSEQARMTNDKPQMTDEKERIG